MNPQDKIQELISRVGDDAEQIIASGLGLQKKGGMYRCPSPHNHRNGDKNPSMGWVRDKNYFNCLGCGENIDIYTYYKNYMNYSFREIMELHNLNELDDKRKTFMDLCREKVTKPTQSSVDYLLQDRGLSLDTIKAFHVRSVDGRIAFVHTKNRQVIGVKYSTGQEKPKYKSVPGSKYFFYNFDSIDFEQPVIVCEGEVDCMTIHECGYPNVVSAGAGAKSAKESFDKADILFGKAKEIIIVPDNDKDGMAMAQDFIDQYGEQVAVVDIKLYKDCKDANELMLKHGKAAVVRLVKSGKHVFDGEWDLDEDPYSDPDEKKYKFIPTGIDTIDEALNDIRTGTVTVVMGRTNSGKSTFVNQVIASAINEGNKTYLVAGEGDKDEIIGNWYASMIGHNKAYYYNKKINRRWKKVAKPKIKEAIQAWHKGKLKLYVKAMGKDKTTEQLFEMLKMVARRDGYDLMVLDNLMSLLEVADSRQKLDDQGKFIQRCHHLATAYNMAVIVVLHTNKMFGKSDDMQLEHISGTQDIANKADNIISVVRYYQDSHPEKIASGVSCKLSVLKNRSYSDLPRVECLYDADTGTYAEVIDGRAVGNAIIGWKEYMDKETLEALEQAEMQRQLPFGGGA